MSRNYRNGLYKRMERQELSALGIIEKRSVRASMTERKPIREIPKDARILDVINYPTALRLEFRL